MTVNIPLLRKAVEWVEYQDALPIEQREWFQGEWVDADGWRFEDLAEKEVIEESEASVLKSSCGTAYCVAGYIGQSLESAYAASDTYEGVHVSDFAAEALGLDFHEHVALFSAYNTAADIREIAEEIAGEKL